MESNVTPSHCLLTNVVDVRNVTFSKHSTAKQLVNNTVILGIVYRIDLHTVCIEDFGNGDSNL